MADKTPAAPIHAIGKCARCRPPKCCSYITQSIPTPRSKADFDHMLWQIAHVGVQFYKDAEGWFLVVNVPCGHLLPDGRCGIYSERPQLCRDYSNDFCEYDAPAEDGFELFFPDYPSLLKYCRRRFPRWDRRFAAPPRA